MITERAMASLAAARARGRRGGGPPGLSDSAKMSGRIARQLHKRDIPVPNICQQLSISRTTFYNYLKEENQYYKVITNYEKGFNLLS